MTDKERELEGQIEKLTVEVSRLRKTVVAGIVLIGALLVTGSTNPDMAVGVAGVAIVGWAFAVIGNALGAALVRRHRRSGHSTA